MTHRNQTNWKTASWQFWLLAVFLALVFLTGGSSRADVESLAILRPVAPIVFGIGLASLMANDLYRYRTLVILSSAVVILATSYLLPLPPSMQPGASTTRFTADIYSMTGASIHMTSTAVSPQQAINSLFSLFVPLAVLVLAIQLNRRDLFRLLPLLLGIGVVSGLLGFLQILGSAEGPLYFYRVTNNGTAVGFFANRNHQALLLIILFPMLAVYASDRSLTEEQLKIRGWASLAIGIFLIPLILVTGSRAGLIFGLLAILSALLLYRRRKIVSNSNRPFWQRDLRTWAIGAAVLALVAISFFLSRANALNRLIYGDDAQEGRIDFWTSIAQMAKNDLPFGSGPGGFAAAYARNEPANALDWTYLNHAHNDWLETMAGFGLPGMILLAASLVALSIKIYRWVRHTKANASETYYAKLGFVIIVFCALASIVDYPLRTPIMSVVFVIALIWFVFAPRSEQTGIKSAHRS